MNRRALDDERLADWVDDRLDGIQRERFEAEMRVNPELRRAAEDYRRTVERLRSALRQGDFAPVGLADRVMQRVDSERRVRRFRLVPLIGSALAAGLLVGLWMFVRDLSSSTVDREDVAARPEGSTRFDDRKRDDRVVPDGTLERATDADTATTRDDLAEVHFRDVARGFVAPTSAPSDPASSYGVRLALETARSTELNGAPGKDEALHIEPNVGILTGALSESDGSAREGSEASRLPLPAGEDAPPATVGDPVSVPPVDVAARSGGAMVDSLTLRSLSVASGSLVYLVELPAQVVERQDKSGQTFGRVSTLSATSDPSVWSMSFVQQPIEQLQREASNVIAPRVLRLAFDSEVDEVRAATEERSLFRAEANSGTAGLPALDSQEVKESREDPVAGAYVPQAGDQVFRLEGDQAQHDQYLRAFAPQVREWNGRLSIQRAFGIPVHEEQPIAQGRSNEPAAAAKRRGAPLGAPPAAKVPESSAATRRTPDKEDTGPSTWIVIRRLLDAATAESAPRADTGSELPAAKPSTEANPAKK